MVLVPGKTYVDVIQVLRLPEVKKQLLDLGAEPVGNSPEEFAIRIATESAKWAKVLETSNIRLE